MRIEWLVLWLFSRQVTAGFESHVEVDYEDKMEKHVTPEKNVNIIYNTGNHFDKEEKDVRSKYVVYWGQNSYGASHPANPEAWEKKLGEYCNDDTVDIVIVSFLNIFNAGTDKPPELNLSNHCNTTFEAHPTLLSCPEIGRDIMNCQQRGKKVLLSLGGAAGSYGFKSVTEAHTFSKTIWNMFLGGRSDIRPFGTAVLDGVDLDIEGGSPLGYPELVHSLREMYVTSTNRRFYIAGAPQCVYPDAFIGSAMEQAWFDYVFIQFYNNYCGVQAFGNPYGFNFVQWDNWAKKLSLNSRVKIFLGVPGSASAANNGYLDPPNLVPILRNVSSYPSFGGVMAWDASQASNNRLLNSDVHFSSFVARWLRDPFTPNSKTTDSEMDFETISSDSNLEGTSCYGSKWSCRGSSYNMCVSGVWVYGECPIDYSCSPIGIIGNHVCRPDSRAVSEDVHVPNPINTIDFDGYRMQMMPLKRISNHQTLVQIRLTATSDTPLTKWRLNMLPGFRFSSASSKINSLTKSSSRILQGDVNPHMALTFTVTIESTPSHRNASSTPQLLPRLSEFTFAHVDSTN